MAKQSPTKNMYNGKEIKGKLSPERRDKRKNMADNQYVQQRPKDNYPYKK